MKKFFLLLLFLLVAWFAWNLIHRSTPPSDTQIREMSFNVNTFRSEAGNGSRYLVASLLQMHQPQVVCLQEVVLQSGGLGLEEFAQTNGYPYNRLHEEYIPGKRVGIAILSRFPVLRDTVFRIGLEREERYAQAVVLDVEGREVTVLNTHFSNRDFWAVEGVLQALQQEYLSENLRTLQARSVINFLDCGWATDRLLLAGDLNTLPFSRAWRSLRSRLRGTAGWRDLLQPTYKVEYQVHIDYIFTSNSLTKLEYRILPTGASDHNPLLVTLGLVIQPDD
ncbi:MAG: endonuclease/exonuclease/phosphatase family protein [Candidatus Delongbacteria bacterium]|nr:endonuclease/exonuclease/phosphatase family protein [Candidatus Delongbacteria bacterium]